MALAASSVVAYRRLALCTGAHLTLGRGTMLHMYMRYVVQCECAALRRAAPLWTTRLTCVELDVVARLVCADRAAPRRSAVGQCALFSVRTRPRVSSFLSASTELLCALRDQLALVSNAPFAHEPMHGAHALKRRR